MLAQKWQLDPIIEDVIKYHHRFSQMSSYRSTVALVGLCDRLCRANGLGYGFTEELPIDWDTSDLISTIKEEWPTARTVNWPQVGTELINYLNEVRKLVSVLFRMA
jgi:hypothetical protein